MMKINNLICVHGKKIEEKYEGIVDAFSKKFEKTELLKCQNGWSSEFVGYVHFKNDKGEELNIFSFPKEYDIERYDKIM